MAAWCCVCLHHTAKILKYMYTIIHIFTGFSGCTFKRNSTSFSILIMCGTLNQLFRMLHRYIYHVTRWFFFVNLSSLYGYCGNPYINKRHAIGGHCVCTSPCPAEYIVIHTYYVNGHNLSFDRHSSPTNLIDIELKQSISFAALLLEHTY